MNPHYEVVALRAAHRCEYCHAPEAVFNVPFEVEHIIPLVRGGSNAAHNWALACRACNLCKGTHVEHSDPVTGTVIHLYHPRQDSWHEHFRVDPETGVIEGCTAIGRATVARLGMNSPAQCAARQYWLRLGVFP